MSLTLAFAILISVGSLVFISYLLKHRNEFSRQSLQGAVSTLLIGFTLLSGELIPLGSIRTITQLIFGVSAGVLVLAEARSMLADRRSRHSL